MSWEKVDFLFAVKDITGGNRKFQGSEYLKRGYFPIVDQGDEFIAGYTNEKSIVTRNKDVVVFGDHTKALKYVDFDFCLGADGVKVLQPFNALDSKFLYYFLKTIKLPDVGYSRHYKFLKDLQIPLPPLATQKRIAEILDAADALVRKDQELLKKYDELAQAIFIDMFGDPVKNEKGWEVKTIGSLTTVGSGSTPSRQVNNYFGGGIPWVKTTEVCGNVIFSTEETISEDGLKNSSCKLYPKDSIIIAMYGQGKTRGQVGILGVEATTNQACAVIRPCKELNPTFLFNYLKLSYKALRELGRGGNQENLNKGMIEEFSIIFPPYKKQLQFNKKMEKIDFLKATSKNNLSQNLFNSLLHKAFKGELVK
jgi:type I restriction enzyme S subunit